MTEKEIYCLPCRAGIQRALPKNIKPFAGFENGLIEVTLSQLLAAERIDEVALGTNDTDILAFGETLNSQSLSC